MTAYQLIQERNRRIAEEQQEKAQVHTVSPDVLDGDWYDTILDIHILPSRESRQEKLILDTYHKWLKKHSK